MGEELQPAARLHLVDVAVDVDLQHHAGMVARPPRRLGHDAFETQMTQVQFIDKDVDHPDRIVLRHIVFDIFGKQDTLPAIFTLNEALHLSPRRLTSDNYSSNRRFHTASVDCYLC